MKSARKTWWVAVKQGDGTEAEPEVVQVWFKRAEEGAEVEEVEEVLQLGNEWALRPEHVRLIERVLPAGRAAAAVAKLRETEIERCYPGDCARTDILQVIEEATIILQGENQA